MKDQEWTHLPVREIPLAQQESNEIGILKSMIDSQGYVPVTPEDIETLGLPNDSVSLHARDARGRETFAKITATKKPYACACCTEQINGLTHVVHGILEDDAKYTHWHVHNQAECFGMVLSTWTNVKAISSLATTTREIEAAGSQPFRPKRRIPRIAIDDALRKTARR